MPAARRFHHAAWFFVDDPLTLQVPLDPDSGVPQTTRHIQRGFLLHGGRDPDDETDILGDLWLYDLSNLGLDDGYDCPWVALDPDSGLSRAAGGMVWHPGAQVFVLAGGWKEQGSGVAAADEIYTISLQEAVDAEGWTLEGSLPDVTYTSAQLGDNHAGSLPPAAPHPACSAINTVPCSFNTVSLGVALAFGAVCDSSDDLDNSLVEDWGDIDPCTNTATCTGEYVNSEGETVTGEYEHDFGDTTYYGTACASFDVYCNGVDTGGGGGAPSDTLDTATAPGLAELGITFDPGTGLIYVFGGTTGCDDGDCSDWSELHDLDRSDADEDAGTTEPDTARAWNADAVIAIDLAGSTLASLASESESADPSTGHPGPASFGRRAAGSAPAGVDWSLSARALAVTSFQSVAVGGTRHQEEGPGKAHQLSCASQVCDDFCVEYESTWASIDPVDSSAGDGLIGGTAGVATLPHDGTGWDNVRGITPARHGVAASWFGEDLVLAMGGRDSGGTSSDELVLFDISAATEVDVVTGWGAGTRYGASLVHDPVSRSAYLFGGQTSDTAVWRVTSEDTLYQLDNAELDQGDVTVDLAATDDCGAGTPDFVSTVTFDVTVDCTDDCWVQELELWIGTALEDQYDTLTVGLTYADELPSSGSMWTVEPYKDVDVPFEDSEEAGAYYAYASIRLPRMLTDGESVEVVASMQRTVYSPPGDDSLLGCMALLPDASSFGVCEFTMGASSAQTMGWTDGRLLIALSGHQGAATTLTSTFDVGTCTAFSTGGPDLSYAAWGPVALDDPAQLRPVVLTDAALVQTATSGSASSLHVFAEDALVTAAGDVLDYSDGSAAQSVDDDLDWLVARLGELPEGDHVLLMTRANETMGSSNKVGATVAGLSVMWATEPDGSALGGRGFVPRTMHEVAHAWIGERFGAGNLTEEVRWGFEGGAALLELMRYPDETYTVWDTVEASTSDVDGDDVFRPVVEMLARRSCEGVGGDLERDWAQPEVVYWMGAYTLSQALHTYLAYGGTEAGFWSAWVDVWDAGEAGASPSDIETALGTTLGLSNFYTEWVERGRDGTPILALQDLEYPPPDTGGVDTGPSSPPTGVLVAQVQDEMFTTAAGCVADFPEFTDVPFYLGCAAADDLDERPFDECHGTMGLLDEDVPDVLTGTSDAWWDLTVRSALPSGVNPSPTWLAVVGNDMLLRDAVPAAASDTLSAARWQQHCGTETVGYGCDVDADGDGHPAPGDCNDSDAAVYPFAAPDGWGATADTNCDSWTFSP